MQTGAKLKLATQLYVYAVLVFAIMQLLAIGGGAQEPFEIYADPADYTARMRAVSDSLRIVLFADLFFIIGFGAAIGITAWAYADTNRAAAWVAGLGIFLVMGLDLSEDISLLISLDRVDAGGELSESRILTQVQISSAKWLVSAVVVVALTFTLPQDSWLERLVVWATRLFFPIGAGLFVTGAFDASALGGLILLAAMGSGLGLLALTTGLRARRAAG